MVLALIRPTPMLLEPGEVHSGSVREDDFEEGALDLDAIGRFMATPAAVLVNRSEANPVGLEMLPPDHIRPAFFRVQVTFSASTHMRLDFLLRVRDDARQLLREQGARSSPAHGLCTHGGGAVIPSRGAIGLALVLATARIRPGAGHGRAHRPVPRAGQVRARPLRRGGGGDGDLPR